MTDAHRLTSVFVELADTLVHDFDVVDFMTILADRSVELLDAGEAGVVLADERGRLRSVGSSSETARLLDLFEIQSEEGPCLDCFRTGEQIVNQSLASPEVRWPVFAPEALRLGFDMVHALPMRLRGEMIGAVNVFGAASPELTPDEINLAQALADIATVGLLQERTIRAVRVVNEQLQGALSSRVLIEQAKGMLAERRGIEMDAAFDQLRDHARTTHQRLRDVAQSFLDGTLATEELGDPSKPA